MTAKPGAAHFGSKCRPDEPRQQLSTPMEVLPRLTSLRARLARHDFEEQRKEVCEQSSPSISPSNPRLQLPLTHRLPQNYKAAPVTS
jgi:hypothetical protein